MKELILKNDKYNMNWIEGAKEWGTVIAPDGINVEKTSKEKDGIITESYKFTNTTDRDIFTSLKSIGIYTTFNDNYTDSEICTKQRCHTHIWCGDNISYVCALRMGGEPPHLGLVLTEGSLGGYSVERDGAQSSNDRGDFILHPSPVALMPNESFTISWKLFSHNGKKDFYKKLATYNENFIYVNAENYTVFKDEKINFTVKPAFVFYDSDVKITLDGKTVPLTAKSGELSVEYEPKKLGEYIFNIDVKGIKTHCRILVQPSIEKLSAARCRFIAEKQQYSNPKSHLDGAYLIYDNEEKHTYYEFGRGDCNCGRERVGMGVLIAKYLQKNKDGKLRNSLKKYLSFVERELFDEETGEVFAEAKRYNPWQRLYNFPWMAVLFLEAYKFFGDTKYLTSAYKVLKSMYEQGGSHFYAIELPLEAIVKELENAKMNDEKAELMKCFEEHCAYIIEKDTNYPPHEVKFEQSIVGPATNILLQMYKITKEEKYLVGAKRQLEILDLFNGFQPDYHLYEVAIRHWDGFWFGKKQLFGDTFPHYWSGLTANAFNTYAEITGDSEYKKRVEAAYRGLLSLYKPDGSASCAYIFPESVNGREGKLYDPYANDQDWGLYFNLRQMN